MDQITDAYARGLASMGFEKGMKTIVMVKYSPELFHIILALFKIGAVPVIVDPGMGLSRMLHCYEQVGGEAFIGIPAAHILRLLKPKTFASVTKLLTVGRRLGWGGASLQQLAEGNDGASFKVAEANADDLLMINFTTGSTGPAKGVEFTHGQVDAMLQVMQRIYGIQPTDIGLVTLPLFALIDLFLGCGTVLAPMDPTKPAKVNPENIISAIDQFNITHVFASPALIHRITPAAQANRARLTTLKHFVCGGAPATIAQLKGIAKALPEQARIETSYGATEALPIASIELKETLASTQELTAAGAGVCVGRPVEGLSCKTIRIEDTPIEAWDTTLETSPGEVGEIVLSGANVSQSYHDDATSDQLMKIKGADHLWHRSGDLGWLDDVGRLWFCGRKNHRVTTAQKQLFTVQCEHIFNQHSAVYRTALIGIDQNDTRDQLPVICVELRPGTSNPDQVIKELRSMAKDHEITADISTFLIHPSFPVDIRHNAKVDRTELRDWAEVQLGFKALGKAPKLLTAIPVFGWLYIAYGFIWPFTDPILLGIWWLDLFLSVVVHALQIPMGLPKTRRYGISTLTSAINTMLFGATYWKFIDPVKSTTLRSDG